MTASSPPLLELSALTKAFGDNVACDAIDLTIERGEIHALLGENGAGKSTLVKMLFGSLQPDRGRIEWLGQPVTIPSPSAARARGIAMVFQHFSLFEPLTVAENIALGLQGGGSSRNIAREALQISERYGLPIDPHALIGDLSAGQRQRVEIVRALMQDPQLLILDEPTSVLTPQEADALFATLRGMRGEGRSVLYISHRLEEVQRLCDRATVLRRGRMIGSCDPRHESAASLASMMVGADVAAVDHRSTVSGDVVLALRGLTMNATSPFATALQDIELEVRAREIVCVAGVAGNGQGELFEALSGERTGPPDAILIDGEPVGHLGISERRKRAGAFVPEERLGHGSVGAMPLSHNHLLARHASDRSTLLWGGWIAGLRWGAARRGSAGVVAAMDVRAGQGDPVAASLSGGNLQKFVVGRELDRAPRLLVVDQPSWGVDAGAASALRQGLVDLAAQGAAILAISQDLDEIFEIASHVCVMDEGALTPKVPIGETTREKLGLLMGGRRDVAA